MRHFSLVLVFLLSALNLAGQIRVNLSDWSAVKFSQVSLLPSSGNWQGRLYLVTDAAAAGDCSSGSGSTLTWCIWNGSSWEAPVSFSADSINSEAKLEAIVGVDFVKLPDINSEANLEAVVGVNFAKTSDNVATATAFPVDPANCGAGQVAGGVSASGVAEDCLDAYYLIAVSIPFGRSVNTSIIIAATSTLTEVYCKTPAGITVDLQIDESTSIEGTSGDDIFSAPVTCNSTGVTTTVLNHTALAENNFLVFQLSSSTGSPTDEQELVVKVKATL